MKRVVSDLSEETLDLLRRKAERDPAVLLRFLFGTEDVTMSHCPRHECPAFERQVNTVDEVIDG